MLGTLKRVIRKICRRVGLYDVVREVVVRPYAIANAEELSGKNILVTGGSSGIGLAIARKMIQRGAKVLITGRNTDKLANVFHEDSSGRLMTMVWDVEDIGGIENGMNMVLEKFGGRLDAVVNNAGISIRQNVGELTKEVWQKVIGINLSAAVFVLQAAVNVWKAKKQQGVVLNIASMSGIEPAVDAYSASKCAMTSLTKGFARSLAKYGIRINAIAPGVVVGTNLREIQRSVDPHGNVRCDWIPMGRFGVPDEIAELASFLVSDRAAYLTGAVVVCDGAGALRQ